MAGKNGTESKQRQVALARRVEKLEQKLQGHQKTLARLKAAERVAQVGSWEIDITTGELSWSDQMYRIFDVSRKTFDKTFASGLQRVHPEDRERVLREISQAGCGSHGTVEYRIVKRDGTIRHILGRGTSYCDEQGRPIKRMGTAQDISERKHLEEELRAGKRLLQTVFDHIPVAVFVKDVEGKMLMANKVSRKFINRRREEIKRFKSDELGFGSGQEFEQMRIDDRRILETGEKLDVEKQITLEGGDRRWFHTIKAPFYDDKGEPEGLISFWLDIAARKQAEEELRCSEARFRDLFEGSVQGILITRTGKPLICNDALARMFGYGGARDLASLENLHERFPQGELDRLNRYRKARLNGGDAPSRYELQGFRKGGGEIWLNLQVQKIDWEGVPAVQSTFTDITEIKRSQEELIASKLETVGEMAKGIAGEFSKFHNAIAGKVALAKMEAYASGDEVFSEIFSQAEQTLAEGKDLVQQLLILYRGGVPAKEPVYLPDLIREALPFTSGSEKVVPIKRGKAVVKIEIPADLKPIFADKGQIKQVFQTIIKQGFNAMPFGGLLEIRAERVNLSDPAKGLALAPGKYVKVAFKDHGEGISKEKLSRIFDPYASGNHANGTLELTSAFAVVKRHEGTIHARSSPGKGTRLTVYLPE